MPKSQSIIVATSTIFQPK